MPPHRSRFAALWPLDPAVSYLNHGSFGACPRAVLERQAELRAELEREPVDFLWRSAPGPPRRGARRARGLPRARTRTTSPSSRTPRRASTRSCARSTFDAGRRAAHHDSRLPRLPEGAGVRRRARRRAGRRRHGPVSRRGRGRRRRARPRRRHAPNAPRPPRPRHEPDGARLPGRTPRRRPEGAGRGDARRRRPRPRHGARSTSTASGRPTTRATPTSGSVRRRAPRSCTCGATSRRRSTRRSSATAIRPTRAGASFRAEFDWTGTADPTPWLSIRAAIAFLGSLLPGGWPEVMAANRALALEARALLCDALGVAAPAPDVDDRVDRLRPAPGPGPRLRRRAPVPRRAHELVPRAGRRDVALPLALRRRRS